jgi:hypothetical protein
VVSAQEVADDGVGEEAAAPGEHEAVADHLRQRVGDGPVRAGGVGQQVERQAVAQADLEQDTLDPLGLLVEDLAGVGG